MGLSPGSRFLDRLVRDRDLAMPYITHDLLSARLLADEVLVLNEGRVVEDGAPLSGHLLRGTPS